MRIKDYTYIIISVFFFCAVALNAQHVEGEAIVQLEEEYDISSFAYSKTSPVTSYRPLSERMNLWLVRYDSNDYSVHDAVSVFRRDERVRYAQPNRTGIEIRSSDKKIPGAKKIPNDPDFPVQWPLDTTGGGRIDAPLAWARSTGDSTVTGDPIVIAVIDDGFDVNHIDGDYFFNENEVPGNGIDDDSNGYVDDFQGWNAHNNSPTVYTQPHGSHVSGIAGAKTNNGQGIAGVAWGAKILPVSIMAPQTPLTEANVLAGYGYVLEMRAQYNETNGEKGAFIVASNSSFGINNGDPGDYPLWCAFYDSLGAQGILNMGATTNSNVDVDNVGDIPSNCSSDYLLAITNSSEAGNRAFSAGFGELNVDLAAPGSGIYSTTTSQGYGNNFGTSMAAPHVAGVVALMYSDMCADLLKAYEGRPDSLALFVKEGIMAGVDTVSSMDGETVTAGKLNAYGSLRQLHRFPCGTTFIEETGTDSCGDCNAPVTFRAESGFGIYTLEWSDDTSTALLNDSAATRRGICADELYTVTVTDELGQSRVDTIQVSGNEPMTLMSWSEPESAPGSADGELRVNAFFGTPPYSYEWSTGDTTRVLSGVSSGEYSVMVYDDNGCMISDSFYLNITGIEEFNKEADVRVYPVPFNDRLNVSVETGTIRSIRMTDVSGRTVFESGSDREHATMDVGRLSPGVYIVTVHTDEGDFKRKVIKK